jgi:hypothetical protein
MTEYKDGTFEYDVCLSFAGEQREYVRQVAQILQERGIRVFFDEYEEADLWGKDLYEHLAGIYGRKARYCILFASKEYAEKVWPSHERANAQARALEAKEEYILPARFDNTEIPGLRPTIGYIDLTRRTPAQLAEIFIQKVNPGNGSADDSGRITRGRFDADRREGTTIENLQSFEPHSFAAVITPELVRLRLPLVINNTGVNPAIIQNLRLRFLDQPGSPPLGWVATRSQIKPERNDGHAFPAIFPIAGGVAHQLFAEFGGPSLGFKLEGRDYTVQIEVKVGSSEQWLPLLTFTLRAGRIAHPDVFITYSNEP